MGSQSEDEKHKAIVPSKVRWGIIGTGAIAHKFAEDLKYAEDVELVAVGSRSGDTANKFGDQFNIACRHHCYEDLARNHNVDMVYIATPHSMHKDNAILCLQNGKSVLCEKPFALNLVEAQEMVVFARRKKLFLAEAMWTLFLPTIRQLERYITEGVIGEPQSIDITCGFKAHPDTNSRLFNPILGGGALLDMGVYPISLATMLFGAPISYDVTNRVGKYGVDEVTSGTLTFGSGKTLHFSSSIMEQSENKAVILGSKGVARIHKPWWHAPKVTIDSISGQIILTRSNDGHGLCHQVRETTRCHMLGRTECPTMPLDRTLMNMAVMDAIRRKAKKGS